MHDDDDLTLVRRIVARDRQAFETLYQRYAPRLYGYLVKWLGPQDVIEEVLDDVMMVVWQQAHRFDYTSRLSTWMFGIAYHKALKARSRLGHQPPPPPEALPEEASDEADPSAALHQRELRAVVAQALATLSPQHRAVVELTFYHEHSYQEIATIMGCPVNTVKTRMWHARQRLMPLLKGWSPQRTPGGREESV